MGAVLQAKDVALYSRCPRAYWYRRVQEVPPVPMPHRAQEAALIETLLLCARGEVRDLSEAQGRFELLCTEKLLGVNWHGRQRPEHLITDGGRWLAQWWALERPQMRPKRAGATMRHCFRDLERVKQQSVETEIHFLDRGYLGWIRTSRNRLTTRILWQHLEYLLASLVTGYANIYVFIFVRGSGEVVRRRWCWDYAQRRNALDILSDCAWGIRHKIWRRCDPASPWCNPRVCGWFRRCRLHRKTPSPLPDGGTR